ncbi:uncharacterized protein Eh isoform X1 [Prorops nasuta]|uniref:uncharacterized protein Eh isoform X1 n=1 Tax=Prorops nasuta TaxID=863751 RepID=UPI0034CECC1A
MLILCDSDRDSRCQYWLCSMESLNDKLERNYPPAAGGTDARDACTGIGTGTAARRRNNVLLGLLKELKLALASYSRVLHVQKTRNKFLLSAMNLTNRLVLVLLTAAAILAMNVSASSYYFGVCIRNCAQCKNMFGRYFKGEMCADLCVKSNGDFIPDCEDVASIERFLIQA